MLKDHGRELEDVTAEETAAGRVLQEGTDEAGAGDELAVPEEAVLVDAADLADDLVGWVVGEEDALEGAAAVDSQAGDAGSEEREECRRSCEDVGVMHFEMVCGIKRYEVVENGGNFGLWDWCLSDETEAVCADDTFFAQSDSVLYTYSSAYAKKVGIWHAPKLTSAKASS